MKVLKNIEQLLEVPGKKIGFFGGSFNPPHFGHLDFIKKAASIQNLDHIIICPLLQEDKLGVEELQHRMRIMDLILETSGDFDILVLSPDVCDGVESKIFIDDIFYLLKRRHKDIFVLVGCDSLQKCAKAFKSRDVTFIVGCKIKRSEVEKQLITETMNCIFIDDIIPCNADQLKNDSSKRNTYLSPELVAYIESNNLYWHNEECENCN
ncbi:MAG: adenylyltransferase/cytidyltransferase family protein [Salinivirgaceae bacterium]|jgi:cytidyltransferase-like protein|nr:adenylyltransferase/cytidyltransferase family protein [Salinivirgaceae bacterium]